MESREDSGTLEEAPLPPRVSAEAKETKKRARLGKILSEIRRQIEFWFGDTNLHKDKFLRQVVDASADGFVPLPVLMTFNRMKTLSTDINVIRRAVSTSTQLELSSDGLSIRRSSPLGPKPEDEDERTVYVERLPRSVTHEWLSRVFSACGQVLYVSLPRFRSSGDPKGFAFVEFSSSAEAARAVQMLHHPVSSASAAGIFPKTRKKKPITGISSISDAKTQRQRDAKTRADAGTKNGREDVETHSPGDTGRTRTKETKRGRETRRQGDTETRDTRQPVISLSLDKLGKRKISQDDKRHAKRQRRDTTEIRVDRAKERRGDRDVETQGGNKETRRDRDIETQGGNRKKKTRGDADMETQGRYRKKKTQGDTDMEAQGGNKETRRDRDIETHGRNRKKKTRGETDMETHGGNRETQRDGDLENQAIDGKETQGDVEMETQGHGDRETAKRRQRHRGVRRHGDTGAAALPHVGMNQGDKEAIGGGLHLCVMSKESWLSLRRDFIETQKVAMGALKTTLRDAVTQEAPVYCGSGGARNHKKDAIHSGKEPPPFVSGVILKISCENGFPGRQEIKGALGDGVVYVDVSPGDTEGYVRFRRHEDVEGAMSRGHVRHGDNTWRLCVLTGDAEQRYWQKILVDRQVKINRPREKKRGASKLLDRVEKLMKQKADVITKHLRFEFD